MTYPKRKKSIPSHEKRLFAGQVQLVDGKKRIVLNSPPLYQHFLDTYCKIGDWISMLLENKRPKRSEEQNNYMHLYFSLIALSCGHTMEEIKIWAKGKILSKGITEVFGDKVRVVKETSKLNISECCEFMNRLQDLTNIPLPDPTPFNIGITLDEAGHLKEIQKQKYRSMVATLPGLKAQV